MDTSRLRYRFGRFTLLASAAMFVGGASAVPCPGTSDASRIEPGITCTIETETPVHEGGGEIVIRAHVENHGDSDMFVLKEPWGGAVWIDRSGRRLVVAHHAYSWRRENALRGGWTIGETYEPQFHTLRGRAALQLEWRVPGTMESEHWVIEGSVSVIGDTGPLKGLQGEEVRTAMEKIDTIVRCSPVEISVRRSRPPR